MIVAFNYAFIYLCVFTCIIQEKKPKGCLRQETQAYVTKENFVVGLFER